MVVNGQDREFAIICGLPRTGSTLLINLLMQNPSIHGEGISVLCELMWQSHQACDLNPALFANNKTETKKDILSALPHLYYKAVDKPIIIEKGRTWCHPANVKVWTENVNPNQKFVILVRPVQDVMKSLVSVRMKNNWQGDLYEDLIQPGSEPIYRSAEAIFYGKFHSQENFLYIDYRDLIAAPLEVLDLIYEFYGWEKFPHNIDHIEQVCREDDSAHELEGLHDIRTTISAREIDVELPPEIEAICEQLNQLVYGQQIDGEWTCKNSMASN